MKRIWELKSLQILQSLYGWILIKISMKKSWKSTAAILNIGDKCKTITLLWLKLIAFTSYNECRGEKNAHWRATGSRAYHSWAQGLSPTYPRCFTFSIFFYFETLIKYFSLKHINWGFPSKPYIKYFHCEILVVRSIAFSNCGVSFIFSSFSVSWLIFWEY